MATLKGTFDPNAAAARAVDAARGAVGDRLVAATLYGSATGADFDPASSDVNIAFVLTSLAPAELEALKGAHRAWDKARVTRPLLLSREGLARSLDVFPLEYLLIREQHRTLSGDDLFAGLSIDRITLRREIERVLRGQELGLAWTYVALASTPSGARHWAERSGTAIAASASGLLHLSGERIPATRRELVERCVARFDIDGHALIALVERRRRRERVDAMQLLDSAQRILSRLTETAERLNGGLLTT